MFKENWTLYNQMVLKLLPPFFLQALQIWNTYWSKDDYIFFNLSIAEIAFLHYFAGKLIYYK